MAISRATLQAYERGSRDRSVRNLPTPFCLFPSKPRSGGEPGTGERLHHQTDLSAYRAAVTVLLCAAETPLLFMGQEWAASSPFLCFTDHEDQLGQLVTAGRREEFKAFSAFQEPGA